MVFVQKFDILQIPPTSVDFLCFLQKSTLIGTFMKKHVFFNFFKYISNFKKCQHGELFAKLFRLNFSGSNRCFINWRNDKYLTDSFL